jgi:hypothetical protein
VQKEAGPLAGRSVVDKTGLEGFFEYTLRLLGTIPARDVDVALAVLPPHVDPPRIAAHLTILNERALNVRFDIDVRVFSAVG